MADDFKAELMPGPVASARGPLQAPTLSGWIALRGGIDGALATMLADPRLGQAAHVFATNSRVLAAGDPTMDSLLKDAGRYIAAMCVLYLHHTGGATFPRLTAIGGARGYISPGRARALLLHLCYLGCVDKVLPDRRGEPAVYVPTARFIASWRNHLCIVLDAARIFDPSVGRVMDRLHEPDVFGAFCRHHLEQGFQEMREAHQDGAFARVFLHRYAGSQILWELLSNVSADDFPAPGAMPISVSAIARRYGVSRTHVARMLNAAARSGLLRYMAGEAIVMEEAGWAAVRFFQAVQFFVFINVAERTMAEITVDSP